MCVKSPRRVTLIEIASDVTLPTLAVILAEPTPTAVADEPSIVTTLSLSLSPESEEVRHDDIVCVFVFITIVGSGLQIDRLTNDQIMTVRRRIDFYQLDLGQRIDSKLNIDASAFQRHHDLRRTGRYCFYHAGIRVDLSYGQYCSVIGIPREGDASDCFTVFRAGFGNDCQVLANIEGAIPIGTCIYREIDAAKCGLGILSPPPDCISTT